MPKFAVTLLLIFISFNLQAQTWELGASGGGAGYMGDLNQNNPLKLSGFVGGGFIKRNVNRYLSFKLNFEYGKIEGADSTSSNQQLRQRNLSFTDKLKEISLISELNFMEYMPDVTHNKYTPFIFLGVGLVGYNPRANYDGQTYDLRPLLTEGQSSQYSKRAIAIPYGVGIKYNFSGKWNLIADVGYRQAMTDYLDDVSALYADKAKLPNSLSRALSDRSGEKTGVFIGTPGTQRGDLRSRDNYMFFQFSISYTFVTSKCYYE